MLKVQNTIPKLRKETTIQLVSTHHRSKKQSQNKKIDKEKEEGDVN